MSSYKIKVFPEALTDIQKATNWYNEQSYGLGTRFQKQVIMQIDKLNTTAEGYKIRYSEVRCMVIKKFPFMVHFSIEVKVGLNFGNQIRHDYLKVVETI